MQLPLLNISLKIPPQLKAVPQDQFGNLEMLGATLLDVEPFFVNPIYAFAEETGKGVMIVSELQIKEGASFERYPLDNLFIYKKNLETHFEVDEISSEEIIGKDISTILLAMQFFDDDTVTLFKGLSHYFPDRFFMVDLYLLSGKITQDDALSFQNMFYSMGIY